MYNPLTPSSLSLLRSGCHSTAALAAGRTTAQTSPRRPRAPTDRFIASFSLHQVDVLEISDAETGASPIPVISNRKHSAMRDLAERSYENKVVHSSTTL